LDHITIDYVKRYSKEFNYFIESGTLYGDTIDLMKPYFTNIHSIEINTRLFLDALKKYKTDVNIFIWNGDSPDIIPQILKLVKTSAVFWLDGHASGPLPGGRYGGCPLVHELLAIKEHNIKTHTIFIDDIRLFGCAEWDYVSKQSVLDVLFEINPNYTIEYLDGEIANDVLVAYIK
jgi:hypothetical protein